MIQYLVGHPVKFGGGIISSPLIAACLCKVGCKNVEISCVKKTKTKKKQALYYI